jgi:hypothetical protein
VRLAQYNEPKVLVEQHCAVIAEARQQQQELEETVETVRLDVLVAAIRREVEENLVEVMEDQQQEADHCYQQVNKLTRHHCYQSKVVRTLACTAQRCTVRRRWAAP